MTAVAAASEPLPEHVTLDGNRYEVRAAHPRDESAVARLLAQLSQLEIYLRFFRCMRSFAPALTRAMVASQDARHMALVAVAPDGQIVGKAMLEEAGEGAAEFGVLVHHDHAHHGLGRRMLEMLLESARQRGYRCVFGLVLRENDSMLQLAREMSARIAEDVDDPGCMRVEWDLDQRPTSSMGIRASRW